MATVPSIGRAAGLAGAPPEADLTRALYERYAGQIFRYCLHQLGSREEAEDAVQSTFLNAFRGLKRGIVPEVESAWLFKIAHNVCLSRRRSSWRRERIESPTDFEVVEELAPAPARREDELIGLQDALGRMPEQQRRAILLREWQGLSYREIAAELETSQAAVETLIFRARRSLAQGLEQPAEPRRRRLGAGLLGNLLSSAQSFLLGGGGAIKVAAVVAAGAGTVVATAPVRDHAPPSRASVSIQRPTRHAVHPTARRVVHQATPVVHAAAPLALTPVHRHAAKAHAAHLRPHTVAPAPAATGRAAAPGQLKKVAVLPAATGKGHGTPPGQAKKQAAAAVATPTTPTTHVPPGQAKKADASTPFVPPGQAKKQDAPVPPAEALATGNPGKGPKK